MLSFRKKQVQPVAEIQFGTESEDKADIGTAKRWLSTEDVVGWAIFKLPVGVDYTHSRVTLKGQYFVDVSLTNT